MVGSVPRFDVATGSPAKQRADLLLLPAFQGPEAGPGVREVGRALDVEITALLEENGFRGSLGEISTLPTLGRGEARTVAVLGLGPKDEATPERIRRAAGRAAATAGRYKTVAATVPAGGKGPWREAVEAFVEGLLLGAYRFDRYKVRPVEDEVRPPRWDRITVLAPPRWDAKEAREAVRRGEIVAEAVSWARDLVNTPALDATPDFLAKEARRMARDVGLDCNVLTKADLEKGGFGGILGVGRGSENPPRLIELRYEGGGRGKPVALTGKGVTFDSGGLSIKDAKQMEWMKSDMAGAATMLAAMRAIARVKPKVNVIAAIPSAENLPGGAAIRPGDVLRHRGGKTSEVLNTDAEGRLVLADALAYLAEQGPRAIIDTATLTGACMVALGDEVWGAMGNDRQLIRDVLAAGEAVGGPGWELPLYEPYRQLIHSGIAHIKKIGKRYGGVGTAALLLPQVLGGHPSVHLHN